MNYTDEYISEIVKEKSILFCFEDVECIYSTLFDKSLLKVLINKKIVVDDYGDEWHTTHYTKQFLPSKLLKYMGSVMPQAPTANIVEKDESLWKEMWRYDRACFAEMDQNCNACIHLVERKKLTREERIEGFTQGKCNNPNRSNTQYENRGDWIVFCAEDCMGMPCWESRYI